MRIDPDISNNFIASRIDNRIIGVDGQNGCTGVMTIRKVKEWHEAGSFVVANAGAYDSLGLNHMRGLIQARIIGAAYKIGSLENLSEVYDLASSDEIRLIVSLDTNEAVRDNKSFSAASGNSARPLYDWETRAKMLALQSFSSEHNLVDYVTKHGPNACIVCEHDSCSHSDTTYNIASSGADLTIVKSLDAAVSNRYPNNSFHVINENEGAFFDRVLNSQISTTALVKRVKEDRITIHGE